MLGKLLGVASMGSTVVGIGLLHRFLVAMAQIMILVIVSSFMLCASLASVFYIFYFCLVQFGVAPSFIGIILGVVALLTTGALVALTLNQLRRLHHFHHRSLLGQDANKADVSTIVMAFIDGFLDKRS